MNIMNTQLLDLSTVNLIDLNEIANTTENRLAEVRAAMHYYRTRYLIKRQGWAFSEPTY